MAKKDIDRIRGKIEELIKIKTQALVRYRKAEFWIRDNKEEYYEVVNDYNSIKFTVKNAISFKKAPFMIKVQVFFYTLFRKPQISLIGFPLLHNATKHLIDDYWSCKRMKSDFERDLDYTEDMIEKDKNLYDETEKVIYKCKKIVNDWERMERRKKR